MGRRERMRAAVMPTFAAACLAFSTAGRVAEPTAAPLPAPVRTTPIVGILAAPSSGWNSVSVLDVDQFPLDTHPRYHSQSKTFFVGPKEGFLIYTIFPPTWSTKMPPPGMAPHFHYYHEWGYATQGDYVLGEPVNPYQKNGVLYHYHQGTWLSRPAYTLHGGSWENGGGIRAQNPYHLLIMEEGDGSIVSVGPRGDHIFPDFPDRKPDPYRPNWRDVKNFERPWLVDSENDLEWETDPDLPGAFVKWLSDDMTGGFRAQLVKIPPGWRPPAGKRKTYFSHANRLRFMVYGDMTVWAFKGPEDTGQPYAAHEHTFIYQPPRSLWGYGPGEVTKDGAVWLEVTYAKGLMYGGGPIESPVELK